MEYLHRQRILAEIEERLGFDANLLTPSVLEVLMPHAQSVVPAVDGAPNCRKRGVPLDARIAQRDDRFYVAAVECFDGAAMELDVLLRHAVSLIRDDRSRRTDPRS